MMKERTLKELMRKTKKQRKKDDQVSSADENEEIKTRLEKTVNENTIQYANDMHHINVKAYNIFKKNLFTGTCAYK